MKEIQRLTLDVKRTNPRHVGGPYIISRCLHKALLNLFKLNKKKSLLKLLLITILDGHGHKTLMRLWLLVSKRTSAVNPIEENTQPLVLWGFCLFDKLKFVGVNYTEYYWQACYNCKVFYSEQFNGNEKMKMNWVELLKAFWGMHWYVELLNSQLQSYTEFDSNGRN